MKRPKPAKCSSNPLLNRFQVPQAVREAFSDPTEEKRGHKQKFSVFFQFWANITQAGVSGIFAGDYSNERIKMHLVQ